MILVTGGSGFIGSHTVRALAELGEACLIVQRRSAEVPFHLADLPVVSERARRWRPRRAPRRRRSTRDHRCRAPGGLPGAPRQVSAVSERPRTCSGDFFNIVPRRKRMGRPPDRARQHSRRVQRGFSTSARSPKTCPSSSPHHIRYLGRRRSVNSWVSSSPNRRVLRSSTFGFPVRGVRRVMRTRSLPLRRLFMQLPAAVH